MEKCVIQGCGEESHSRGYCSFHYRRWWIGADVQVLRVNKAKACLVCGAPVIAKNLCAAHYQESRRENNPALRDLDAARARKKSKLTIRQRENLMGRSRPDRCEVCNQPTETVFDHCHATGAARGWLCNGCNSALGYASDNPEVLRKLADYLENSRSMETKTALP